jgi:hypothetical protein
VCVFVPAIISGVTLLSAISGKVGPDVKRVAHGSLSTFGQLGHVKVLHEFVNKNFTDDVFECVFLCVLNYAVNLNKTISKLAGNTISVLHCFVNTC